MSLSEDFPKAKREIEAEVGIADKDVSKPLLLRLIEQVKFGAPVTSSDPSANTQSNAQVMTFGSNTSSNAGTAFDPAPLSANLYSNSPGDQISPEDTSPEPNARKENSRKSKKDKAKKNKTNSSKADKAALEKASEMAKLDDLPSLGNPLGQRGRPGGFGGFGGFDDAEQVGDDESQDGFDDFDINEDVVGDSSNKFDDAEKHLQDFYKEENEGYKIGGQNDKAKNARKQGFKVNIQGVNRKDSLNDDEFDEEIIEEDIQTDRDEQANLLNPGAQGQPQYGITVSQSLGIDPSVDSLAIEDYDYVEIVN